MSAHEVIGKSGRSVKGRSRGKGIHSAKTGKSIGGCGAETEL